ncbi:cytochrome c biogenesis protein ResB [Cellulosimicrobium arenosum]|uniref:Cytochrome c biogenesis protein ResB n=1 Tax=Cellulosimicrobium arenosum TaxID=2708133 RepID=A0A927GBI2_9MICO|nr:cytochrome c biogenesis protein ResB [Cellulosimicrobium arenosum]MBD8079485.1 cytochrome c biogenesis protein ResB [Cellulosimicrobium arenosum]
MRDETTEGPATGPTAGQASGSASTEDPRYRPEGIHDAFVEGSTGRPGERPGPAPTVPALGWKGTLRWTWRQLTSMRVALMLLMLLAVAAVPGSVLPQRPQDPAAVLRYLQDHPTAGEWLDRLGFFDVYSSVWFSAIYLLLFVSLVGCILPRTHAHLQALGARPPRTPRRFERFGVHARVVTDAAPDAVVEAAAHHLRGRVRWLPTFRVETRVEEPLAARGSTPARPAARTVAAERGYLRETGNLVFHLSLVGLLIAVALGQLLHYRGQAIVTEGRGFANAVVDYDTFENGAWFRPSSLVPFSMTLDSFEAEFSQDALAFAQSRDFTAHVTVRDPGGDSHPETIKVNHPLTAGGAKIYLQGNGYAPEVTVRDADGEVAFSGRVPFLPEDTMYTSQGVIKVPDVSPGLDQIGLVGSLLPTAELSEDGTTARSVYPQPLNPLLVLEVYSGDLGLDEGLPQNVYRLDTEDLDAAVDDAGERVKLLVAPGETVDLPDGTGTITFESLPRYVALDLRHDPSLTWVLVFALGALGGLAVSLFTPRRRVWVRTWREDDGTGPETRPTAADDGGDRSSPAGRTVVEVAGLARGDDAGLQGQVDSLLAALPGVAPSTEGDLTHQTSPGEPGRRKADR